VRIDSIPLYNSIVTSFMQVLFIQVTCAALFFLLCWYTFRSSSLLTSAEFCRELCCVCKKYV
jgi:hypothetical protein